MPDDHGAPSVEVREESSRARKQRRLGEGEAALVRRSGVATDDSDVSPPLDKVQERFTAFAEHARASAHRGSSSLAMCVAQADGSGAREVDWLSRTVAVCSLGAGAF